MTHPLRIAHILENLEIGGAEKLVVELCRLQRDQHHEPSVHCLFAKGALAGELAAEGIGVHLHGRPGWKWRIMKNVYRHFSSSTPDVVHCHNATATVIAAVPARLAGVRAIFSTRHGLVPPPYSWRREVQFGMASRACRNVIAVCETARVNLNNAPHADVRKLVTIYNGARELSPAWTAAAPVKSGFVLVTVGRLVSAKAYDVLLRAIALARLEVPDLKLWMVGKGNEEAALQKLASELKLADCVTFFSERRDVGAFLANADVFVLSSISEGLPVSLLEAMAAGLPSIVTDVGGMPEVIGMSGTGVVVPASNPQALATAITDYARRRDQLPSIGQAARAAYEQHFTLQRMADEYMNLYRQHR